MSNKSPTSIELLLIIILTICFPSWEISVDPRTSLFLDQYQRYRVFHGVNVVQKLFPFHPKTEHFDPNYSLADADLYNLRAWGFNAIRLHVAWEGV
jgi:endoglycosylceramidase